MIRARQTDGICYRLYVENQGWLPAACNGEQASTTGQSLDAHAIQIWSNRPGVGVC